MARTIKEEDYTQKRNEILDTAYRLVMTKGYEQMTIQDVISALGISKGAFYHYFDSKQALLAGLIERIRETSQAALAPIIENPEMTALEKIQAYFTSAQRWKSGQKDYMLQLLKVWYDDDNALVRQKVYATTAKYFASELGKVIHQGVEEGAFTTPYPDQAAGMMISLLTAWGDEFAQALFNQRENGTVMPENVTGGNLEVTLAAYNHAVEQVLGAKPGTLQLIDVETLREWMDVMETEGFS